MEMLLSTQEVGEKIRALRGDLGQEELGKALGCTKNAISQYERGLRMPSDKMKVEIANYFGLPVSSIFFKQG